MEIRQIIADSYLAGGFSEDFIDRIAVISDLKRFESGANIMHEDDDSRDLMVLASGRAEIRTSTEDFITILKPSTPFGEVAFLDGKRRSSAVVALEPCEVVIIPEHELKELFRSDPPMAVRALLNLSRLLCDRLRKANQQIAALNAIEESKN